MIRKAALLGATCASLLCAEEIIKPSILLIAFGTSKPEAQIAFDTIEEETQKRFPTYSIHWAYTSQTIRKILAKRGILIDSPIEALQKLEKSTTPAIYVQSLHTVAGHEYGEMKKAIVEASIKSSKPITFGKPLLYTYDDLREVTDALFSIIPVHRKKEDVVLFMGHGNGHHPSDYSYIALTHLLQKRDPNVYMATVEGAPSFGEVLEACKEKKIKKVWLHPFMSVAGDHARNDMSGSDADSWKSQLEAAGIKTESILKGTGEYKQFISIWLNHLESAMDN